MDIEILDNAERFFGSLHLYDQIIWEGEVVFKVIDLIYFRGTIDCYCVECNKHSTFRGHNTSIPKELSIESYEQRKQLNELAAGMSGSKSQLVKAPKLDDSIYVVKFSCTRNGNHNLIYFFRVETQFDSHGEQQQSIQKIGQFPSYASINLPDLKKYRSIIDRDTLSELTKGILLGSHDTAIGGFVYLRRVFEKLVKEAADVAVEDGAIKLDEFTSLRMNEKISAIKDYLPEFIVEHPKLYSLMSKGVHELDEAECSRMFDIIKLSIEMILEQKLEEKRSKSRLQDAKDKLQKALSKHS